MSEIILDSIAKYGERVITIKVVEPSGKTSIQTKMYNAWLVDGDADIKELLLLSIPKKLDYILNKYHIPYSNVINDKKLEDTIQFKSMWNGRDGAVSFGNGYWGISSDITNNKATQENCDNLRKNRFKICAFLCASSCSYSDNWTYNIMIDYYNRYLINKENNHFYEVDKEDNLLQSVLPID